MYIPLCLLKMRSAVLREWYQWWRGWEITEIYSFSVTSRCFRFRYLVLNFTSLIRDSFKIYFFTTLTKPRCTKRLNALFTSLLFCIKLFVKRCLTSMIISPVGPQKRRYMSCEELARRPAPIYSWTCHRSCKQLILGRQSELSELPTYSAHKWFVVGSI